jgi:hypothetical protein
MRQHARHGDKITRQPVLYKKSLHGTWMGEFWIAMPNKNDSERQPQKQQSYGLKRI